MSKPTPSANFEVQSGWRLRSGSGRRTAAECEAVISTLQEPVLVLSNDLAVELANAAFCRAFRVSENEVIGSGLYELGNGQWDIPELRRLLDQVIANRVPATDYRLDHEFNEIGRRILLVNAHCIYPEAGEPMTVLVIRDNTELEFAKEYSDKLIDALRDPFVVLDWELRVRTANAPFYAKFQVGPEETESRFVYDLGNGQWNIPRLRELLEDILPRDSTFNDFEVEHEFRNIGRRVMLLNARRIDRLKLILLVIEDVTETRRAAAQENTLLGELQHRVKNLLATVRALSQLTIRGSSSLKEFGESFDGRLNAMARTQDLLVRECAASARLRDVIGLELDAVGGKEGSTFTVSGPHLRLSDRASHAFAMTIHELATNAAKYGALSNRAVNGRVEMNWSAYAIESGKVGFNFNWREHGLAAAPTNLANGFGTQIIENSLPYLFGGSSKVRFHPDGVECIVDIQLPPEEVAIEGRTPA